MVCKHDYILFLRDWLQTLSTEYGCELNGKNAWAHIRSLAFPFFDCFPTTPENPVSGDLLLMQRCPNLNHVALRFHAQKMVVHRGGRTVRCTVDMLRAQHNLQYLFSMRKLKTVYHNVSTNGYHQSVKPMYSVKEWLRAGFENQMERRTRDDPAEVKMFAYGGPQWSYDMWKEVDWDENVQQMVMVKACEAWMRWPLIPCVGFTRAF